MPWLEWLDRKKDVAEAGKSPYRLLEPLPKNDYGDPDSPNMLIQGDNLDALKALLPYYAGQVKCIFIDPPYNTKSAFDHYDDNLEHAKWLSMIYPRIRLLRELLSEDGSIWITIDDNEAHYLKVICDEVFGRNNFICNAIWQKKSSPQNDEKYMTASHDHLLIYAKNKSLGNFEQLPRSEKHDSSFTNPDNDPRGPWSSGDMSSQTKALGHSYPVVSPSGKTHLPAKGRQWAPSLETYSKWLSENRIWFGEKGNNKPRVKQFLSEVQGGIVPMSIWPREDVGDNQDAKREVKVFNSDDIFETPKPERLIERILFLATQKNDLILDSFLGSGTTAAVAHKIGRRWIGIEMGKHAETHCLPRLKKVVDGEQGGISKAVNWIGGGGFRYYRLGPPIFDENGQIRDGIRFEYLAAHIWFSETGTARSSKAKKAIFLGEHADKAYYLLYNGILGDKRPQGGNVLTLKVLSELPEFKGTKVVYGEATTLSADRLRSLNIVFKQTPYDIMAR